MQTILIILALIAIAGGVGYILIKKGKIADSDGDFIPDVVEDKVDEVKGKVQKKVKAVKTRVKNILCSFQGIIATIEPKLYNDEEFSNLGNKTIKRMNMRRRHNHINSDILH